MQIRSTVELKILKFVMNYGSEMLIYWLDHFDNVISLKDYPRYRSLEREACKACDISYADLKLFSNTGCTNAKRIISFISSYELHLPAPSIAKLINVSNRAVNYYIKDAEQWINKPQGNKVFVEAFNKVNEAIKITQP